MAQLAQSHDIYGGIAPLDLPAYSLAEIAHCIRVPSATVRTWVLGRTYPSAHGERRSKPLIEVADNVLPALSFRNAVELHVLSAIRRKHGVRMPEVRKALDFLERKFAMPHPLADQQMATDGKDLFIERYGRLVNISREGQLEIQGNVAIYLSRIDRDPRGMPIRLYPFTRSKVTEDDPMQIAMNPRVQFGRPCLAGTSIPTSVIGDRYEAGDAIQKLAEDYGQAPLAIEEAIRFEFGGRAA